MGRESENHQVQELHNFVATMRAFKFPWGLSQRVLTGGVSWYHSGEGKEGLETQFPLAGEDGNPSGFRAAWDEVQASVPYRPLAADFPGALRQGPPVDRGYSRLSAVGPCFDTML